MHGDKVLVSIIKEEKVGKKCEGEIYKVIKRANKGMIGTFQDSRNFGFLVPEDKRIHQDIFIPKDKIGDAKDGQIVVAEITKWPRSEEHTSELQSRQYLVCRLLLEKKNKLY